MSVTDTHERLQTLVKELPPELHDDVINYIESLLPKSKPKEKYLRLDWGGALKGHYDQYTSVELQKKALDWREEMAMKGVSGHTARGDVSS